MEYENVKEWLDKLVERANEAKSLEEFNEQIRTCNLGTSIQLYEGIDIVADVMGLELKEEDMKVEAYHYIYSFVYKGVCFEQIEEERMESFVHMQ